MHGKGWFRLWVLLSLIAVPAATFWSAEQDTRTWASIDQQVIKTCVDAEWSSPTRPDALKCSHRMGADQTIFQREHTTPLQYWSTGLAIMFGIDLLITAAVVVLALSVRWVVRGFRSGKAA
jgi:hypothetical protein